MDNNKQIMKLYTEEQVIEVFEKYGNMSAINARNIIDLSESIELPSDEEIDRELESHEHTTLELEAGFKAGANYVIYKIQGGNK